MIRPLYPVIDACWSPGWSLPDRVSFPKASPVGDWALWHDRPDFARRTNLPPQAVVEAAVRDGRDRVGESCDVALHVLDADHQHLTPAREYALAGRVRRAVGSKARLAWYGKYPTSPGFARNLLQATNPWTRGGRQGFLGGVAEMARMARAGRLDVGCPGVYADLSMGQHTDLPAHEAWRMCAEWVADACAAANVPCVLFVNARALDASFGDVGPLPPEFSREYVAFARDRLEQGSPVSLALWGPGWSEGAAADAAIELAAMSREEAA